MLLLLLLESARKISLSNNNDNNTRGQKFCFLFLWVADTASKAAFHAQRTHKKRNNALKSRFACRVVQVTAKRAKVAQIALKWPFRAFFCHSVSNGMQRTRSKQQKGPAMVFAEASSAKARYLRFEGEKQSSPYNYPPMRQKSLKSKENAIFGGVSVLGSLNGYRIQRQKPLILGKFAI